MYKDFNQVYGQPDDPFYYGLRPSQKLEEFLDSVKPKGGMALDMGSGEGRNTLLLARHGFHVHAVDISSSGLHKLEKYAYSQGIQNIDYIVADVKHLQLRPSFYDAIVAVTILDHLNKEDGQRIANTIQSTLKPGGFTFVEVFTRHDPGAHVVTDNGAGNQISDTASFIKHYFDDNELAIWFIGLNLAFYAEQMEYDNKHGTPHYHGIARLLGIKKF